MYRNEILRKNKLPRKTREERGVVFCWEERLLFVGGVGVEEEEKVRVLGEEGKNLRIRDGSLGVSVLRFQTRP